MAYRYINGQITLFRSSTRTLIRLSFSPFSKMEPTRKYYHSSPAMAIAYGTFAVFQCPQSFFMYLCPYAWRIQIL